MDYQEYKNKIAKFAKRNYDLTIDFADENIEGICEQGFRLGSFPYYCASQILIYVSDIDKTKTPINPPTVKFKIREDKDWEEWQVLVYINGKLNKDKSYHASDEDDAISTRHAMMKELDEHPERYQE